MKNAKTVKAGSKAAHMFTVLTEAGVRKRCINKRASVIPVWDWHRYTARFHC